MKKIILLLIFICSALHVFADFYLVRNRKGAAVCYTGEEPVVKTAVDILVHDSRLVCEHPFSLVGGMDSSCVVIGVIGKEKEFDNFLSRNKVDLSDIIGKWEAFKIQTVSVGGKTCLLVAGSDPRGTAYGVLELSRRLGISPWVWWADVVPEKKNYVVFRAEEKVVEKPSVQYRGIFLNDEDWALMPWSSKTFEPSVRKGEIGPATYSKIFELLLRLRANTIWPAMHECTVPFYYVKGNKEAADKYGIVVGTSHCEPLMRNSAGEWNQKKYGSYNYLINKENIKKYWTERLQLLTQSENFYTMGLRGVHDGRMRGVKSIDEETEVLGKVIKDQRELLVSNIGKKVTELPQAFVPYKEVLKAYDNGLQLPEDITLIWCDDNHGYITRLSNEKEQKRSGGGGVYYHVSYWGKPHDYLWLSSTQPALIYREMKRAWDYNARKLWILNVGDIKPGEYSMEFFLDMAWDINSISESSIYEHQREWLAENLDKEQADSLAYVMREYYRLAGERKPEHLGWNRVEASPERSRVKDSELNPFVFGDEISRRIGEYERIEAVSSKIYAKLSDAKKPAYFQLVHYPVCASAAMNKKMLYAQKARLFARYGLPVANEYSEKSLCAYGRIAELSYTYNKDMLKGKWDNMMDMKPRDLPVFQSPVLPEKVESKDSDQVWVWIENDTIPQDMPNDILLPDFVEGRNESFAISIFSKDDKKVDILVSNVPAGFAVKEVPTGLLYEARLSVTSTSQARPGAYTFDVCINGKKMMVYCLVKKRKVLPDMKCIEKNKMIAFNAADYANESIGESVVQGLGHSASAVRLKKAKKMMKREPNLTYEVYTESTGNFVFKVATVPSHPANNNELRYAVVLDDQEPAVVSVKSDFLSDKWSENVLRNQTLTVLNLQLEKPGKHIIRVYALDEDLYFDQFMLEFKPDRKSYLLPVRR